MSQPCLVKKTERSVIAPWSKDSRYDDGQIFDHPNGANDTLSQSTRPIPKVWAVVYQENS